MKAARNETIGVLWSGGLDSTYLIYWLLEHGYTVKAYYSEILNNVAKSKMEINAIDKMTPIFRAMYQNRFDYYGVVQQTQINGRTSNVVFQQMPIWLLSALYMDDEVKRVAIGYVMNDDAISYLDDIQKAWKALSFLLRKTPTLWFPLTKMHKEDICAWLPMEFKQHVVSCEYPRTDFSPCGTCHTCQRSPLVPKQKYVDVVKCEIQPTTITSDAVCSKVVGAVSMNSCVKECL